MRVLVSSTAGHGHVYPLVPLARALQAAGHDVLWAGHPRAGALVTEAGLTWVRAGLAGAEFTTVIEDLRRRAAALPPADRAAFLFPDMFGSALAPAMAADLLVVARDWQPDLLLHEQAELASPLVGAVLGVPSVMQSYGGAIPAAFVTAAGDRLRPAWHAHGMDIPPYAGCFTAPFLDICPPSIRPVPLDHVPLIQQLQPVSYTGPEQALPPGVEGVGPLIYLTLGTIPGMAAVLSGAVAALAELGARLIVTVGPEGDPTALGEQPTHVTVTRYVSQTQLLPLCDLVVSHTGSGTFLGALSQGLPQLCLPQGADQFRNARACAQAGTGLMLHPEEATPAAIYDAVTVLLTEKTFGAQARRIRAEVTAMPPPHEVVGVLEALC